MTTRSPEGTCLTCHRPVRHWQTSTGWKHVNSGTAQGDKCPDSPPFRIMHASSQFRHIDEDEALVWYEKAVDAADLMGLDIAEVETIVRNPQHVELDPTSAVREWHTERRRSGDVRVVVTYPPERKPMIWGVYVTSPDLQGSADRQRKGSVSGATGQSNVPTTLREMKRRLITAGLKIESGRTGDRVLDSNGNFVFLLHKTPSEFRSLANMWAQVRRKALARGVKV